MMGTVKFLGTHESFEVNGQVISLNQMREVPLILLLIEAGDKVSAIKHVRQATGLAVKDAKDFVDWAAAQFAKAKEATASPDNTGEVNDADAAVEATDSSVGTAA